MRILLRRTRTGEFCSEAGDWTLKAADARDFKYSADAILYATRNRMTDTEVLFDFGDSKFNFTLGPINNNGPGKEKEA